MKTNFVSTHSFNIPLYTAVTAWGEHIPFAFELTARVQPKIFVELGTHFGVSYFSFCQSIKNNNIPCSCYAVDTWTGDEHAGYYGEHVFNQVAAHNNEHYAGFSYLLRSTFKEALNHFKDKSIDLLHIDGLHTYEAVKEDFDDWLPKLSDSSVVIFHDIAVRERDFGVFQLWEDLSRQYPSFSFIHGHGLGVLATGKNIPQEMQAFFHYKDPAEIQELQFCYQRLGSSISEKINITQTLQFFQTESAARTKERDDLTLSMDALREDHASQIQRLGNDYHTILESIREENTHKTQQMANEYQVIVESIREESNGKAQQMANDYHRIVESIREEYHLKAQQKANDYHTILESIRQENNSRLQHLESSLVRTQQQLEVVQLANVRQTEEILESRSSLNNLQEENTAHVNQLALSAAQIIAMQQQHSSETTDLQNQISFYQDSLSWKITQPLRSARRSIVRLLGRTSS